MAGALALAACALVAAPRAGAQSAFGDAGGTAGAGSSGGTIASGGSPGGNTGAGTTVNTGLGGDRAALAPFGASGTVLPRGGYGSGVGGGGSSAQSLRRLIEPASPSGGGSAAAARGPAWQITPSIGLTEELTSNATGGAGDSVDFVTVLQPGIAVQGDTQRLQVNLAYSPQIYLYAVNGDQNRVGHDFNARALATLIPQTLFLDVRGLGSVVSRVGGLGPSGTSTIGRDNAEQDYSFSASPYAQHRFGTFGTGEVGYTIDRTIQESPNGSTIDPLTLNPSLRALAQLGLLSLAPTNQRVTTQNAHAAFVTGQDFGRYNASALASATRFEGTGVLRDSRRDIVSLDNGYAITRAITALATIGYENIQYNGTSPVRIHDILWDAGVRLTPNAFSTITARYGHRDGFNSLLLDASVAPTPRTRVTAQYSAGLTTGAEQLQNALAGTDLDALGNPVDPTTGVPVFNASNFFGLQNDLYKLRRLSLSGAYVLGRDTFGAEVDDEDYTIVSSSPGQVSLGSNSGTFGSLSWSHEFTPRLTGAAFFQYGERSFEGPPASSQRLVVTTLSATYLLGRGFTASAQYSFNRVDTDSKGLAGIPASSGTSTENLLLLSLLKTF